MELDFTDVVEGGQVIVIDVNYAGVSVYKVCDVDAKDNNSIILTIVDEFKTLDEAYERVEIE